MGRRADPKNGIRKSANNQDLKMFIWSVVELYAKEVQDEVPPKERSFTGRVIAGFTQQLYTILKDERESGVDIRSEEKRLGQLQNWFATRNVV